MSASSPRRQWLRHGAGAALGLAAAPLLRAAGAPGRLAAIRERGRLQVGLYNTMPPFHAGGRGIDVALAQALAESLGVALVPMPFDADEDVQDDLRNMVWRGSLFGYGPADLLIHVPIDAPLIEATPQVRFVAPYHRETLALAHARAALSRLERLADLNGQRVAVAGQTLAGWLLIGERGRGGFDATLATTHGDGTVAAQTLLRGDAGVAAGTRSELESVLGADDRFAIVDWPGAPAAARSWAIGCAVRRDAEDLALALQQAVNTLAADGRLAALFAAAGVGWRRP